MQNDVPEAEPAGRPRDLDELARSATLSSYRESLLEQIFVADLVQASWLQGLPPLELAHAFVDFTGYDLVITCGSATRHVQLKATRGSIAIHRALAAKPSGCCVLMEPRVSSAEGGAPPRISLIYRFLGGDPGERFEIQPAWQAARNQRYSRSESGSYVKSSRTNHVTVPASAFGPKVAAEGLAQRLFGVPPTQADRA